jgi:hypothetical protein
MLLLVLWQSPELYLHLKPDRDQSYIGVNCRIWICAETHADPEHSIRFSFIAFFFIPTIFVNLS